MAGDLVWPHFRTGVDYGILVLDLTVQGVHITNQTVIIEYTLMRVIA